MTQKNIKNLNAKLTVEITYENDKIAQSVCKATAPENIETPLSVIARSEQCANKVIFSVESNRYFKDIITTVDDFFEKIDLSYKTVKDINRE